VHGDVGDRQPVRFGAAELAIDEVRRGDDLRDFLAASWPWKPVDLRSRHQHLDCVVTDLDAATHRQLGVHTASTVGAARRGVDLDDLIEQPGVSNRSF
jgi:hypothetical protein